LRKLWLCGVAVFFFTTATRRHKGYTEIFTYSISFATQLPMSNQIIKISYKVRANIEQQALDSAPNECCGLLGGNGDFIATAYPLHNTAESPESRYFAAPEDLFAAMRQIRAAGQDLLGIYHSHPRTSAYPSPTDVELAFYPEAIYFIISLANETVLQAFKIIGSEIQEVEISTIDHL
jgi:[CysO sulfur-carrier protein]-S-L-cysteine hydrolase